MEPSSIFLVLGTLPVDISVFETPLFIFLVFGTLPVYISCFWSSPRGHFCLWTTLLIVLMVFNPLSAVVDVNVEKEKEDSVFVQGLGSQVMLQDVVNQGTGLRIVVDNAKNVLKVDEVEAVSRHLRRVSLSLVLLSFVF